MLENKIYVIEGSQCLQIEHEAGPMDNHPLWICKYLVEKPQVVKNMQKSYLQAGTDILKSLTYQVNVEDLMKVYDISAEKARDIIKGSVELARTSFIEVEKETGVKKKSLVCGAVGPYGALQHDGSEYTGKYVENKSVEELREWHRPRVSALVEAGVDFLCFETLPSIVEARALLALIREYPNQKAWLSFTCKDGKLTAHDEPFGECVSEAWKLGRDQLLALGCNCTQPYYVKSLLESARAASSDPYPFVVYSNSGETFDLEQGRYVGEKLDLGTFVPDWLDLNMKFLGGCCRTDVADIRRIREIVDSRNK